MAEATRDQIFDCHCERLILRFDAIEEDEASVLVHLNQNLDDRKHGSQAFDEPAMRNHRRRADWDCREDAQNLLFDTPRVVFPTLVHEEMRVCCASMHPEYAVLRSDAVTFHVAVRLPDFQK
ncbi:hypothetical protein [Agromyces italicus]|uniref:hypothetical protein n=1 Tax=Agromyces italicus TaxID=279572 RepID=UPI0003B6B4FC|nr:hypothetical protein [Agromyces italicus]